MSTFKLHILSLAVGVTTGLLAAVSYCLLMWSLAIDLSNVWWAVSAWVIPGPVAYVVSAKVWDKIEQLADVAQR